MRVIIHLTATGFARFQDIGFGKRGMLCATLGEKIAAQEGPRRLFHEVSALPGMGQVRCRKPPHAMPTERYDFTVLHRARSPVGYIADRDDRGDLAAERESIGGDGKKLVERTAFVGFVM